MECSDINSLLTYLVLMPPVPYAPKLKHELYALAYTFMSD